MSDSGDRLRRALSEKPKTEARLAELSKLLRAPDAAAAAADLVRKAQARVPAGPRRAHRSD